MLHKSSRQQVSSNDAIASSASFQDVGLARETVLAKEEVKVSGEDITLNVN